MTWNIVLGIIALVGFILSISAPMIKLNTSITRLNDSIDVLKDSIERTERESKEDREKIWKHIDAHDVEIDKELDGHENRIVKIEHKFDIAERIHPELMSLRSSDENK